MQEVSGEEQISLIDWTYIIFKRWKVILAVFVITFSVSSSYNLYTSHMKMKKQKPVYTASIKMIIGPESLEVTTKEGQTIKRSYSYDNEFSLLGSNIVAKQAAAILKEKWGAKESEDKPAEDKTTKDKLAEDKTAEKRLIDEIRGAVKVGGAVKDQEFQSKNLVNISATSGDPHRAFDIVNAVVEGYQKQKKEDEDNFFKDTYRTFTEQLDVARENLHKAEDALTDFIMENEEIAMAIKSYGISEAKDKGDVGLDDKYLSIKSEISTITDYIKSAKESAIKNPLTALALIKKRYHYPADLDLKRQFVDKEEELRRLLLINEEAHPEVVRAREELRSVMNKIKNEIEGVIENMKLDLATLESQGRELSLLIKANVHKKVLAYNISKRDIDAKRGIYDQLAHQLQDLNIGEKLRRYTEIRILEPAAIPTKPSNPIDVRLSQILLFSLTMAIFSSITVVYVIEMLDTSVKDVEQLEKLIDVPVLVTIPWYRRHKHEKGHRRK